MKKVLYAFLAAMIFAGFTIQTSIAQLSKGGTPSSFIYKTDISNVFDERVFPGIDINQALREDSIREGALWAGRSITVDLDMQYAGTWTNMPDGSKIWRLKITSAGAKALGVCYDNFFIPEGGKLFLYNESETQVIGAYTSENNPTNGIFSTELIQGSSVILEYVSPRILPTKVDPNKILNGAINGNKITNTIAPVVTNQTPRISISQIAYVYKDVPFLDRYDETKTTGWGASLPCEVNVNCSEGAAWQSEKRGVAEIWLLEGGSWGWCTGSLINTTNNSGTPYFLTADHCHGIGGVFATAVEMNQWQFYFKYEGAGCPDPGTEPTYSTLTGCALVSSSPIQGGSDFCLVLLNTTPTLAQSPYYNGWDRTATAATSGVGIHHPAGDIKKISTFTSTLTTATWNDGTNIGAAGAHWAGTFIATANGWGQTEGGSSGSPIFNSAKRVVGTLTGGTAANCATGSSFDYGKFWYHWDQAGAASTQRLKPWLDPVNAGSTFVNGYDPFAGFPDFFGTPTTVYQGGTVNFTDITNSATTWLWQFEGGTPATSTVQNPTNITYNQQGTYRVSLTTFTVVAGTQTTEKVGYITVLPGSPNIQIWCDDFSVPANWTINTSGGYTDVWAIQTAAPTGTYSAPMGRINSTSAGNYALFDSDAKGAVGDNQWTNLTTTTGQSCVGYETVFLKFEQNYRKFYDSTLVYVSNDNFVTSTRYVINEAYANNDASTNPDVIRLDITSVAAGQANVKVKFTFRSTQNMGANAGWAYAWEIDDVCLEGVLPGYSLPVPNFTATTSRKISPSQNVSYQDLSQNAVSWLWTFEGGTPATSTAQNPTGIIYNTQGYYDVTLQVTNANGYVSTTKTDYIQVFYDCSYDSNVQEDDGASVYLVPGAVTGYTPGHNSEQIAAYADKFTIGNLTGKVKSLMVAVGLADIVSGTTNVTFTIWNNNAGVPGTVIATRVVAVKDLLAGYLNSIEFAPVAVGSTFFAGFQLNYAASQDTFACYLANGGVGRTNTAYVFTGGSWVTYESKYAVNGSLYILPEFCFDKPAASLPVSDFYASQTEIAPGTNISFTDQTIGGIGTPPTAWSWTLTGAVPATSIVQNPPTENYAAAGLYDVTLNATNANGSDPETKVGYIHVSPTSNIVFWNFPNNPDNATADGGIAINTTRTITNWGTPTAQTYATAGATTRCVSSNTWNDGSATPTTAWSVTFATTGYTNIKLSSKQSAPTLNASPRDFSVYYNAGSGYQYLTDVHPMTTQGNWTQGVLNNVQLPSDCDNQPSVEIVWYKTSDVSYNGGAVTVTATSLIDDIYVTGQACSTLPAAAGTITGASPVCQGSIGNVFTVPAIAGATIYNWTVPAGATITAGNYTNTITVSFAQNQAAGNITVFGENICGNGTVSPNKALTFTAVPAIPGPVTGSQSVLNGQTGIAYSVPVVAGATSYTWTLPSFATLASGSGTRNITVDYTCPGTNGVFSVHANNACGAGLESYSYAINILCNPPVTNFMADVTNVVAGSTVNFTDLSTNSPSAWSWTFPGGTPGTSTVKNPSIVYNTPGIYDVTLVATNALGNNTLTKVGYITVTTAPVTIVTWNFPNNPDNALSDGGIAVNNGTKSISVQGGVTAPTFATAGATTRCASAIGWATGNGTKYWQVDYVTTGYQTLTLSSKMTGNNIRSPRDFKVQYSLNGTVWTDVPGATCVLATTINTWNSGTANLTNVPLPVACNNQAIVYLRWIMTSNTGLTGAAVTAAQASLIDDIVVMGIPITTPPVANFSATPTSVCVGGTVNYTDLSTGTPTSWAWTFAGGTPATSTVQNPSVVYNTAGTYNAALTATNANGNNTMTKTNYITVNALPTAAILPATSTICAGQSATLTASGGTSYLWSNAAVTAAITVSPASTTTYTVTVTNAAGCTAVTSRIVTVNALPTATITPASATICAGQSSTLTASGGTSYLWSNAAVTAAITVSPASTTTYTVTVTNAATCTATSIATVTVNALPTATITPASATICAGQSSTLTASGGTSYLWSNAAVTAAITVSPAATTTYTVTVTNAASCTAVTNATVTVNALPTASIAPASVTICAGQSSTLTASGGTSYLWSNAAVTAVITVSPAATTTYTVTVTNAASCTAVASRIVTVNALPTAAITPASASICAGQSSTLTASGGTSYLWSNAAVTAAITVSPAATTTYAVTVTNAASCTATSSATVTVNALPTATITPASSTICVGQSSTLTASGGTSYLWSNAAVTAAITVSPAATTTYTVTVTNAATCTATSSAAVTVNTAPIATITPASASICIGQSSTLTASGGTSYLWSNAAVTAVITVSPAATTTYTVTVTNAATCTAVASRIVTVNALPTATITPASASICAGQSSTLTASGGTSYLWSNAAVTAAITISPAATTTYTVTVTNAATCTATSSATVTVNALPTATITPASATICAGQSSTLTASGGTSYLWSNAAVTAAITVSPAVTTIYTVTVTNAATCTATSSATVTVNAAPIATITPASASICFGQSSTLTASGGTSYLWSNAAVTAAITISPAATTTYTVTVTNAATCTATSSATVTVNALPTATITPATSTICAGQSSTLTASGGTSYLWSNAAITAVITVSPVVTTTYSVTVTNASGCTAVASRIVTVNALPIANAGIDQTIPNGTSTSLTGSAAGGSGTYTWSWAPAGQLVVATVQNPSTVNLSATTNFTLTVSDVVTGCLGTDVVQVIITGSPLSVIASATPTAVCSGSSTQLNAVATGGSGTYTYSWTSVPVGFTSTLSNPIVSPLVNTTYTVTVNDGSSNATNSVAVTVNALPIASISPATSTICAGQSSTLTASGGTSYLWSNAAVTSVITVSPAATTTYTVTVTNAATCTAVASRIVTVNALPIASVTPASATICSGQSSTLTASGGTSYLWSNAAVTAAITVSPAATTTYTVTVTNAASCTATSSATVTVNALPIATITPATATICAGQSSTLTASGGASYLWSNAAVTAAITVSPAATTTYTVTVTNAATCTAVASRIVTVNALPIASVTPASTTICAGQSSTLTASGGTSYLWSNTAVTTAITVSPAATTTYTVTVTNAATCTATSNATVTVNAVPTVTITPATSTICAGQSSTLTASGGTSYLWSNAAVTAVITVSPASTTTYTVTVTNAATCTAVASRIVTVTPLPTVNAGVDQVVCAGTSVTLSGSGATTYVWDNGVTNGTPFTPAIGSITYTVTGTTTGCTNTDQVIVTVNAIPTVNAGVDQVVCAGTVVTLSGSGATTYSWNNGVTNGTPFTPAVGSLTYTVTGITTGCSNTDQVVVTVNALPTVNAGVDQSVCVGTSITLSGSGATTYVWDNGVTNGTPFTPAVGSITYTVTGTTLGCTNTDQVVVTVNSIPTVNAGIDQVVCAGTSVTLSGSGATTYAWDNGVTNGTPFTPAVGSITYTVTGTTSGCSNTDQVIVTVNSLPIVNAGVDQIVCTGTSVTLSGSGATTYTWDNGVTNGTPFTPSVGSITYTVTGTTIGCSNTDQVVVTVNAIPTVDAGVDQVVCAGTSVTLSGSGATIYTWDNSVTDGTPFTPSVGSITYTVTGTTTGCSNTDQVIVTVNAIPTVNAGTDQVVCTGTSVTLSGSGATTYSWDNGVTDGTPFTPIVGTITYTLTGTTTGCSNTDQVVVTVNTLPTVNAGVDQAVCVGTAVTLTGSGATTYVWDNGVTDGTPFSPAVGTITYTVSGTTSGCTNTDQVIVTVNGIPTVNAGVDQVVCSGTSVTLSGSGATTYAWDNGVTNGTPFSPAVGSITYTVTGTTSGCTNTDQVVVTVNAIPTVIAGTDQVVCAGTSVTLSGIGATTYTWDNGVTDGTPFSPATGTITYTVTGTTTGCSNTDQVVVTVNAIPTVNAGADQVVCAGTSVTLSGSGATIYTWDNGVTDGTPFSPTVGTITYTVTGTSTGCTNTDQVIVTVNEIPVASVTSVNATCGLLDGSATASAIGGTGIYTYQWDASAANQTSATAVNLGVGSYSVTVSDGNCSSNAIASISENGAPTVSVSATTNTICEGQTTQLTATGADTYTWSPSTYLSGTTGSVVDATPLTSITYTVQGTTGGCSSVQTIAITVNPLPVAGFNLVDNGLGNVVFTDLSQNATSWAWDFGDGSTDITQSPTYTYTSNGNYTITQTVQNGCGSDVSTQNINMVVDNINTVSVLSLLEVYPNPSNGHFNIKYSSNAGNSFVISIVNVTGEVVSTTEYTKNSTSTIVPVDLAKLAKGIYQVKVVNSNEIMNSRILIDRY